MLIIRAWFEHGSEKPLRATVKVSHDVAAGIEQEITYADADAVCARVRTWLDELDELDDGPLSS